MTKAQKDQYVARIHRAGRAVGYDEIDALGIFRATRAAIAASVPGSQRKRPSAAILDAIYILAFPSILRAVK